MQSILREMYEREIIPPEAEVPHTEKYRSLMREAGERHTALIERMRAEDPGLVGQLESYLNVRGQAERGGGAGAPVCPCFSAGRAAHAGNT